MGIKDEIQILGIKVHNAKPFYASRGFWPFFVMAVLVSALTIYEMTGEEGTSPSMERLGIVASLWGAIIWRMITKEPLKSLKKTIEGWKA